MGYLWAALQGSSSFPNETSQHPCICSLGEIASLCDILFLYFLCPSYVIFKLFLAEDLYCSLVFALLMEHNYNSGLTSMHAFQFASSCHNEWRFESSIIFGHSPAPYVC